MIFRTGFFATLTAIFVTGQPDLLLQAALATLAGLGILAIVAILIHGPEGLLDRSVTELIRLRREPH